jgi:hypothetical protein
MLGQQCIDDEILILLVFFRGCAAYLVQLCFSFIALTSPPFGFVLLSTWYEFSPSVGMHSHYPSI